MQRVRNNIHKARKHTQKASKDIRKLRERRRRDYEELNFSPATLRAIEESEIIFAVEKLLREEISLEEIEIYDDDGTKITDTDTLEAIREARKISDARKIRWRIIRNNADSELPESKLNNLPRDVIKTQKFLGDWDRLSSSGEYDLTALKGAMMLLIANDAPLPPEWKDHNLKGTEDNLRECHVKGDLLLVYQIDPGPAEGVTFLRAGTHSELFGR